MAKAPKNFASVAKGYANLWKKCELVKRTEALKIADRILSVYAKYTPITKATGMPEWAIAILHYRESNLNFGTYLGNGQTLSKKTTIKPVGRGPFLGEGAFIRGAIDAIELKEFQKIKDWSAARFLYESERYNGFGYMQLKNPINSPYVWGGTNLQQRGKYVRDGVFDANVMDAQLGSAAILKALCERSPEINAQVNGVPTPEPTPVPVPEPIPSPGYAWEALILKSMALTMEIKTARDVHLAMQSGKTAAEIVKEREGNKMANEIPETVTVEEKPWYASKTVWLAAIAALAPLLNMLTKGSINIDPSTQEWIANLISVVAGTGAAIFRVTATTVTPIAAARIKNG